MGTLFFNVLGCASMLIEPDVNIRAGTNGQEYKKHKIQPKDFGMPGSTFKFLKPTKHGLFSI